jgi:hypothetical protein
MDSITKTNETPKGNRQKQVTNYYLLQSGQKTPKLRPERQHIIPALTTNALCFESMTTFQSAYNDIAELVQKFDEHREQFIVHKYMEVHARAENRLVCELYGLMGEEIRIVEGNS